MNPACLKCGRELLLLREGVVNYSWQCATKCLPPIDTGVAASDDLSSFERDGLADGQISTSLFTRPLHASLVPGAKVYMPFILYHFIECTRGACYNSIFFNLLVPHLDSVPVLDYVLRSPVVRGLSEMSDDVPKPKMFGDLYARLMNVKSPVIQRYLTETFGTGKNGNR